MRGPRKAKQECPPRRRAVGYVRVSTGRQAAHEISLADQQRKIATSCEVNERDLVKMFIEGGASARTDKRAVFQEMVTFAKEPSNDIQFVVVYNFARYFRNTRQYLNYRDELKQAGVTLISATQEIPEGAAGELLETILAAFDGHASQVNSETVQAVMLANAEGGFWNGSRPPFGYTTEVVAVLRKKEKKRLAVDETEAAIVRLIFALYLHGDDGGAPKGIKATVDHLNSRGYRHRGKLFYTSHVERILKRECYAGTYTYNRTDSRTHKTRAPSQWVKVSVPVIIEQDIFDAVQRTLRARRPKNTPPRTVTGPTLLTGIAVCEGCGAGMLLRTGKSGRYKYLTCASAALRGKRACKGQSVRMDMIDNAVIDAVTQRVFEPSRLRILLGEMFDRSEAGSLKMDKEIKHQRKALAEATTRLQRIYSAIENGLADLQDPLLKERVEGLRLQRSELHSSVEKLKRRQSIQTVDMSAEKLKAFSSTICDRLGHGDPGFRRSWLRLFVDKVTVGPKEIRICGSKVPIASMIGRDGTPGAEVPSYDRKWRAT
jgi:site-specific DNA recombinase